MGWQLDPNVPFDTLFENHEGMHDYLLRTGTAPTHSSPSSISACLQVSDARVQHVGPGQKKSTLSLPPLSSNQVHSNAIKRTLLHAGGEVSAISWAPAGVGENGDSILALATRTGP